MASPIDLELAWKRVKEDIASGREFVRHPHEEQLVDGTPDFIHSIDVALHHPSVPFIADVPKGGGAVRPAALLPTADRIVYAALVGAIFPELRASLSWAQGWVDFAYQMASGDNDQKWVKNSFTGWNDFRNDSIGKIDSGDYAYMVKTDVAGFYENIDLSCLASDLKITASDHAIIDKLMQCLNRWAVSSGRGIPQGMTASDLLAKLYMNAIDNNMVDAGWCYSRYVDDVRIFVPSISKAKEALVYLTNLMRKRGMSLQSAKTEVLPLDEARVYLNGAVPLIERSKRDYLEAIAEAMNSEDPYLNITAADVLAIEGEDDIDITAISQTFDEFIVPNADGFDKSLFHFLVNRMGAYRSDHALDFCLSIILSRPQETEFVLRYVDKIGAVENALVAIEDIMASDEYVYDYQWYSIYTWLSDVGAPASDALLRHAKGICKMHSRQKYLRSACRRYIGKCGRPHDLEEIEASYANASDRLEQAQILCDLHRMETGKRNGFLARAARDHALCGTAERLVKGKTI